MEFRSVIFDECGVIVRYCSEMTREEIVNYLSEHPEYRLGVVEC